MLTTELDTPVPLIDLDKVEHNLSKMQAYCDRHGLKLRPHIKTHKLPAFAHQAVALGAVGITCQKLGEAEVMADAGLNDILISYPLIGPIKAARLAALARRARLQVAADSPLALETLARAAAAAGHPIGVLIEFDSGNQRTGVTSPEQVLTLARAVQNAALLSFEGLMTYPSTPQTSGFVAAARELLAKAGIEVKTVSGGGTPNAWHAHEVGGVTEVRVGTYIYHDRATVGAGVATLDECALHLTATVISRPTEHRAIIDAGSKSLSSDLVPPSVGPGYGVLPDYPGAVIERLSEEHGMIDLSAAPRKPALGERLRILPNHVCVVTNLHDEVVVCQAGQAVAAWPVAARGKTR